MTSDLFDDAPDSGNGAGWYTAHCDGGSRGNPGPAGFGAVIEDPEGRVAARLSHFLGTQTNNYAEYSALLAVLEWALKHEVKRLRVVSDSELMVRQMKGQYKVSNAGLRQLWEEARRRAAWLVRFDIRHTLRAGNQEADRLANEAMDRGMRKNRDQGPEGRDQGMRHPGSARAGAVAAREQGSGDKNEGLSDPGSGTARPASAAGASGPPKAPRQTLSGYVKNGVVHLLDGELPDGIFVKITTE